MSSHVWYGIGFVLLMAFVLLLVTFRSIVIPIKAIVLNLLSVSAALGLVTYVFQDGHFEDLLNFQSTGAITAWFPLMLFVILFGLSMDYHVFILSRIKEAVDRGESDRSGRVPRHQVHGRRGDRGGDGDGRGVLDLRHALVHRHEAVRRRAWPRRS